MATDKTKLVTELEIKDAFDFLKKLEEEEEEATNNETKEVKEGK